MPHLQTSESVVWVPNYEDIDLVEVEADLRRQEERRDPKKAEENRLKEAARKTEAARIEAERQETERMAEAEKVEAECRAELQELRQAEERAMAESQESARRLEESRSSELLEQAKAEVERAKIEAEKAKAEAQRAVAVAYQSIDLLVSGNITEHEAQKALSMLRQNQPVSLEIPTPKPIVSPQNPPWGNGFGSFQNTKSAKDEPSISPLFASEINLLPTPQGGATPLNNPPLAAEEPDKKKPLLGAAFGGDESSAS
jgi:hypothetical protein